MSIRTKLENLRRWMNSERLDAYIVTGSDPHGSEYPPSMWRTREWISGFTGSAGTVVVTAKTAGLWTDFRYWIQAADELADSGIDLFKEGDEGVSPLEDWLAVSLPKESIVGVDGRTQNALKASEWKERLAKAGIGLVIDKAPWDELWVDRPALPGAPVIELKDDESGESRAAKLRRLRDAVSKAGADTWLATGLDASAWLLNIRGGDVPYNPVVPGYLLVKENSAEWFVGKKALIAGLEERLAGDGVAVVPYEDFDTALAGLDHSTAIMMDRSMVSQAVVNALPEGLKVVEGADPVMAMKARKNDIETENIRKAMVKDGIAVSRFLRGLEAAMANGESMTEIEAAARLLDERKKLPGFLGESFSSIPAVGGNGAICHYEAKAETAGTLSGGSQIFLLDSGGQWEEGTTDITRTVSLGNPTPEQQLDYTLVLKGHIALSVAAFPQGTRGYQLDTLARMHLWAARRNFGHGTGHGVGYRLSVHEGPQRISPHPIDVALEVGMVVSNEPGVYRENEYGIRIENLILCKEEETNSFGGFLSFETLTWAPYDSRLIDISLLETWEIDWINEYHEKVYEKLSPAMDDGERQWLKGKTAPLSI